MVKRKMILVLGLLGLCMAVLTACSSQPSKNADGTPSTLKSRYLGYYRSDTDNAYYFQENTNEFNFNVQKSRISDGSGDDFYTKKYIVVDEEDLNSELQGEAQKYKDQISDKDIVFYLVLEDNDVNMDGKVTKSEQQAVYQSILSNDGENIKIIALGSIYGYGDDFVFTGTAKE
ncbi:hypothetical protein [Streptococcus ovis]|uniref:hypothetical protein n=1 Tax=Streptococcus ovis TaxID=82806 RepID=UPI00037758AA|nr:hypothetical protein [Streptococcus ovis]